MNGKINRDRLLCLYSEEQWVDYASGDLPRAAMDIMAQHAEGCSRCRNLLQEWSGLIEGAVHVPVVQEDTPMRRCGRPDDGKRLPGVPPDTARVQPAAVKREERYASAPDVRAYPSRRVYRSLRRHVRLAGLRRRLADVPRRTLWAACGAAVTLLLVAGLYGALSKQDRLWNHYVQAYEPEALSVLQASDTLSRPIAWSGEMETGRLLYNRRSGEILVLVEGLLPGEGRVFQAWSVGDGGRSNLGLLRYHSDRAHLYLKRSGWPEEDDIALTIEPDGGSRVPTSPDTILLRLPQPERKRGLPDG